MHKLVVLAFLAAGIAALFAIPAAANPRGTNGKIVTGGFNTALGQDQVYSVDPDGSDFTLLVEGNNSSAGQWSYDGSRITVGNDVLGQAIFDFDTGVLTSLDLGAQYPDLFLPCPVWSPDDKRLACEGGSLTDPSLNGIYTVRSSDGGGLQRVTSDPGGDCPSDYSPNGKRIVFERWSVGEFFTVKLDGSGLRQITPDGMTLTECNGSWSPQGNEILFSAHVPNADYRSTTWVVHSDGTGLRQIPIPGCGGPFSDPTSISCFSPSWSPDGQKIVFVRLPAGGQRDLYTVNADGSDLFQVTNTPEIEEGGGDWGTHPVTP
jgi:Tol biopolymer transport system component